MSAAKAGQLHDLPSAAVATIRGATPILTIGFRQARLPKLMSTNAQCSALKRKREEASRTVSGGKLDQPLLQTRRRDDHPFHGDRSRRISGEDLSGKLLGVDLPARRFGLPRPRNASRGAADSARGWLKSTQASRRPILPYPDFRRGRPLPSSLGRPYLPFRPSPRKPQMEAMRICSSNPA